MTTKTHSRGRKAVIYDEQLILNIIYQCIKDLKIIGKIKYSQVHKYAFKQYSAGEYEFLKSPLSEDYWRKNSRQGKELIDRVNQINEVTLNNKSASGTSETIIHTEDAVNKLFTGQAKDKKRLIDHLRINEVKAKKLYKQTKQLQTALENERKQKEGWKNKAENLQILLFQILEYSASKEFPIENLINTGKTRTASVTNILEHIFDDDPAFAFDFQQLQQKTDSVIETDKNVLSIKQNLSAADDFGLF